MQVPDHKTLKKLTASCRKLGITHFKCSDFEFTLSDIIPHKVSKLPKRQFPVTAQEMIESYGDTETIPGDFPTPDELLMWSAAPLEEGSDESH